MNFIRKMRKLQHNAKALSPVVASIILIAVTVAVSLAVAVWMGGLTTGFMQTEQLQITSVTIDAVTDTAVISVSNTGTSAVTINQVFVGSAQITTGLTYANVTGRTGMFDTGTLSANSQGYINIGASAAQGFVAGNNYMIKAITSKGTTVQYSAVAGPT